jgi:hypothetical protein
MFLSVAAFELAKRVAGDLNNNLPFGHPLLQSKHHI